MLTGSESEENSELGNQATEKTRYREIEQTSYFLGTEGFLTPC